MMTDRPDYSDIIARLERASGADRELDAAIACLFPETLGIAHVEECSGFRPSSTGAIYYNRDGSGAVMSTSGADIRPFTASLDASLDLVGEKLPGWTWMIRQRDCHEAAAGAFTARLASPDFEAEEWASGSITKTDVLSGRDATAGAITPALAVLIALFRALEDGRE